MTGRWVRNQDGVLVFVNGSKLLGAITEHDYYPRSFKAIIYSGEREAVGAFASVNQACGAVRDFWLTQD